MNATGTYRAGLDDSLWSKTLYKFRSLTDWKFIVDIIVNQRLFAAPFEKLNDPMEGRYYYFGEDVSQGFRRAIRESKMRRNICSLSCDKKSTLLWSYYANGHTGVAFALVAGPAREFGADIRTVTYDNGVYVRSEDLAADPDEIALRILIQKQMAWSHEEEVRVFSESSFVSIELREIVLGLKTSEEDERLLRKLAAAFHPTLQFSRIRESDLDSRDAVEPTLYG